MMESFPLVYAGMLRPLGLLMALASGCSAAVQGTTQIRASYRLPAVYAASGEIRSQVIRLDKLRNGQTYSLLFSVNSPEILGPDARLQVELLEGDRVAA